MSGEAQSLYICKSRFHAKTGHGFFDFFEISWFTDWIGQNVGRFRCGAELGERFGRFAAPLLNPGAAAACEILDTPTAHFERTYRRRIPND
jgi:hypothetical protein